MRLFKFFSKPNPVVEQVNQHQDNKKLIKNLLEQGNVLTSLEMAHQYNIIDIRKPISDLIKEGMPIKKLQVNNGKKHYKKYWVEKEIAA